MNGLDLLNIPLIELNKELFKRGDFDFITITERGNNVKQQEAFKALLSGDVREILYGGAAGGAKSWTGATYFTFMALLYPGTRYFVGRDKLTDLRNATLSTFQKVFKTYGVHYVAGAKGSPPEDVDWVEYREKDHYLEFSNGSRIDFIALRFLPTDKMYERFGSFEYTQGWIEEAGEVNFGAYDVLKSRIGRHLNDKYGLRPLLFITCNPKKNWLYYEFYTPWKRKTLSAKRMFIQAFVQDNPANESTYLEQLQSLNDKVKKERLLFGNWDYDDDPAALCEFDAICDMFTNAHVIAKGEKRISADLAMHGRDRFIIGAWTGMVVTIPVDKPLAKGKEIETDLKKVMVARATPHSKTVVDSDGLGAYLESYLVGIKEFHGGSRAINIKDYGNLKSECAFTLAAKINNREIRVICTEEQKQKIIEELGVLKRIDVDKDEAPKKILQKKDMKELLGRSPDYMDMLIMGMYFEVYRPRKGSTAA
ncbi:terminase family protein [Paraflavitalea sp. CAU 1676]|uniref:terminase large subunit domain-containing protein n=1 Tax=Paraflavitalea sp. CAU 1676 TaxID=3032598 RepID=UPI0023DCD724|nr:terminase family protein [Paraflavitalea sp. CAU 1676]MDF2189297.1 terminase family protein [Paraflavitalea sp. CAU 1676]